MDVDQLKQLLQQYFLNPLNDLPIAQIKLLETNHDQSVQDFQNAIGALFAPDGPPFQGKAADAIAEYIGKYLDAEEALSPYAGSGLSDRVSTLLNECATALAQEEPLMKTVQGNSAWAAAGATLVTGETVATPEEGAAPPTIPVVQLLIVIGTVVAFVWASADQQNKINELTDVMNTWVNQMQTLAQQADPPGSQLPGLPSQIETAITMDAEQIVVNSTLGKLTPAQRRLFDDVKSLLGTLPYNDADIEALILAGYLDPNTIAGIIKGGSGTFAVFDNSNIATMMNQLTDTQQQKVITNVEAYQKTHPGLTSQQVYNYLWYIKMKAQLKMLEDDILGKNPGDPLAQAIAKMYPAAVMALVQRLDQKAGNNLLAVTDPFSLGYSKLESWYSQLTGIWGEWSMIKHYYQRGSLVAFSVPLSPDGEVDLQINESGIVKWVEVKNALTTNQWGKALTQAGRYAKAGAKNVVIELPQQGVNGTPDLSQQQLNNLKQLEKQYPGVKFEVITGASDPGIQIPFDPPSNNWGSFIP